MNTRFLSSIRVSGNVSLTGIRSVMAHAVKIREPVDKSELSEPENLANARPFESLPGPSKYQMIREFMPGGRYYKQQLPEINRVLRREYGKIFLVPGLFGKRAIVFTFDPEDYEKVFRTEGIWPIRRGLDVIQYYRKVYRPEVFKNAAGLVAEQGENWAHFRTTVNPVMMNPKTTKFYIPRMDNVIKGFIERIKVVRDPTTFEVPADFEEEINHWAMESVCLIALDTNLGLISDAKNNPEAKIVIDAMKHTFELLNDLDFQPSIWKIVPTPKFRKILENFDNMTKLTTKYIDAAIDRLKNDPNGEKPDAEKSILESLLKINREVAITMAMDILLAGVDSTSSAMTGCLISLAKNPSKQDILRQEVLKILPEKNSALTVDKMKHMPYMRACIKEAQRIYPVSTGNFRTTGKDLILSGYRIPKLTDIAMPSQLLQSDEDIFPRSKEFLPERWLRESTDSNCPTTKNLNPFVFLPFGFGPRMCIGRRIVDLELETALCRLIRSFYIEFDHSTENAFKTHVINVPDIPLQFKFRDVEK